LERGEITLEDVGSKLTRILISAVAGWILSSLVFITGVILHINIPLIVIVIVGILSAIIAGFLIDKIAVGIARYLLDMISLEEQEHYEESEQEKEEDIEVFLIKSLVERIAKYMLPDVKSITIILSNNNLYEYMESPDALEAADMLESLPDFIDPWNSQLNIIFINNKLTIILDKRTTLILNRTLKKGEGEYSLITDIDELKTLYDLIKKYIFQNIPLMMNPWQPTYLIKQ